MKTRKVVSREYKLMLKAARFGSTEKQLLTAAGQFWEEFAGAIEPLVVSVEGTLDTVGKQRLISFHDSDARHLWAAGYIYRARRAVKGGRPEVTLKFRHADRYVAESRQMKSRLRSETKFEEDIKAPFVSLYSFSTRGRLARDEVPATLDDVTALFPDLAKRLGRIKKRQALRQVNGVTACEVVVTGPIVTIGAKPLVEAECALIVWNKPGSAAGQPLAVEFSYRYGNPGGRYSGKVARRAFNIFEVLQRDLTDWVDAQSTTKTALVFG